MKWLKMRSTIQDKKDLVLKAFGLVKSDTRSSIINRTKSATGNPDIQNVFQNHSKLVIPESGLQVNYF